MFDDVARKLQAPGAIAVIPTDTLYGVVARAADPEAVARLYALKHRENKPGTLIAANIDQLVELGIKRRYLTAVEQFWPGAVSIIIPCADPVLAYLHQCKMSLAIRIPSDAELQTLLLQTGPLQTSSANQPGEEPAPTVAEAKKYFGEAVDFYMDGGDLSGREASTIIKIVDDAIEVIRQGAVKINAD
jgi:L-threonylcarbamoyladenylate synthase